MLFEPRLKEGIHEGRIVLAFRRWRRGQVVAGRRYRTGLDMIEVESVDIIEPTAIDARQASEAGYATVDDVLADLRGDASLSLYRIRFRRIDEPDPRDVLASAAELSADEIAAIGARLGRMDRSSSLGPWTMAVLAQISDHPGTVSTVLAQALGWPRQDFKARVRRLKELGLTVSLEVGYRLSARGAAYLTAMSSADSPTGTC